MQTNPDAPIVHSGRWWGAGQESDYANCYEYAVSGKVDTHHDHNIPAPGNAAGYFYRMAQLNETALKQLIKADGVLKPAGGSLPSIKKGYYAVAAYIGEVAGVTVDFHFVRQNHDGTWSEKAGLHSPSPVMYDLTGNPLSDAPSHIYRVGRLVYRKIGYYYAPTEGGNVGTDRLIEDMRIHRYIAPPPIAGTDGVALLQVPANATIEQALAIVLAADLSSGFSRGNLSVLHCDAAEEISPSVRIAIEKLGIKNEPQCPLKH